MNVMNYEELTLDSEMFATVRANFDLLFQKLLKKMIDNDSTDGSITLKVDVELENQWVPEEGEHSGNEKLVHKPTIKHKVTTAVPVKDSMDGKKIPNMELVYDEKLKRYVLKYITGGEQMTIFDKEIQEQMAESGNETEPIGITGPLDDAHSLPENIIDADYTEVESREAEDADELQEPEEETYEEAETDEADANVEADEQEAEYVPQDEYEYEDPEEE